MSNVTRNVNRAALKNLGPCPTVRAGSRRQSQWKGTEDESDPTGDVIELIKYSGNSIIIDHICDEAGGYFVKYEDSTKKSNNAINSMGEMLKEITDVFAVCGETLKDGKISSEEIVKVKKECQEAMQGMVSFMECIESGRFE